jgi:excisionase family DNA binding protein
VTGDVLTLREAADELGVHYMTVYRYVRLGMLGATKSSSGTWQVTREALEQVGRGTHGAATRGWRGDRERGQTDQRLAGPKNDSRSGAPWAQRLESRLIDGDAAGSWGVFEAALAAGSAPADVYCDVLTPAMVSIGERWARGEIDVWVEHRASAIATRLIGRLGPQFSRRGRTRGAVIVGAPEGERHGLPLAMLGDLLRLDRWEVLDLGADVPTVSFVLALEERPDVAALGLSVTTSAGLDAAADVCASVRRVDPARLIVVGGAAITDDDHARALGADARAASATALTQLLAPHPSDET